MVLSIANSNADNQPPVVLKINLADFDPLTGRTYRGGLARTGAFGIRPAAVFR